MSTILGVHISNFYSAGYKFVFTDIANISVTYMCCTGGICINTYTLLNSYIHIQPYIIGTIDYISGPYIATFFAGLTNATLNISINNDDILENNENFFTTIESIYAATDQNFLRWFLRIDDTCDRAIVNIIEDDCK